MVTDKHSKISTKLASLRKNYQLQLPDKIAEIEQLMHDCMEQPGNTENIHTLYRFVHSLVGSAATFGAIELSHAAMQLDSFLKNRLGDEMAVSQEQFKTIELLVKQIKEQAAIIAASTDISDTTIAWHDVTITDNEGHNLVYVVDDDELLSHRIARELQEIQFDVETFTSINELVSACEENMPTVIIMGIIFPASDDGIKTIDKLRKEFKEIPPVIYISSYSNIDIRMAAMKLGASRFFEKPVDFDRLCVTVETLSNRKPGQPYRVLVIDADVVMANYYKTVLEETGIDVRVINNPDDTLEVLSKFNPELILMDMYMPQYTGIELASVIRQDDDYVYTSIVFLSSEQNQELQLDAINIGADDFLNKPVAPDELLSAVVARVKRSRRLNSMYTDMQNLWRESESQKIALDAHSIVSMSDATGKIIYVNDQFCKVSGYSKNELLGENHRIVKSGDHSPSFYEDMWKTISSGEIWSGEIKNKAKNGDYYWVESTIVPFLDHEGIPYKYVSIRTDITAMMKVQEDLFDAKEKAEQASRAKTEFLSSMSHELRTPLNAILGFTQLLQLEDSLTNTSRDYVNEVEKAGTHLLGLIKDVLELARIESDRLSVSIEPVSLCEVMHECESLVQPMLDKKTIKLTLVAPDDNPIVSADRLRLKQVILNLLSNAIKYNKDNGEVKIYCSRDAKKLRLHIEDTGIGIDKDKISELFQPFHRLVDSNFGGEGVGIGLVITRRLLDLMGGKIGVDSIKGEGTTFWIELRLDSHVAENDVCHIDAKDIKSIASDGSVKKFTVLYVEDNPVNMLLVEKLVKKLPNIELLKAFTPDEGIRLAAENDIDLFLLDINLPGMNGYELLTYFRSQKHTQDIKAFAITANAMKTDVEAGMQSGFDDYITKPIIIDEFINKLKAVIE